jgi:hypothetical protein
MKKYLTDSEFDTLLTILRAFFVANATKYGFNMTWFTDVFLPLLLKWVEAFGIYSDPAKRTHGAIVAKDKARDELYPELMQMVRMVQDAPDVTDAQLADLTIPRPKPSSNKPLPVPPFPPDFRFDTSAPGWVTIHILNSENMTHGKPVGGKGCLLSYEVTDVDPEDKSKMANRRYVSGGKIRLEFNLEQLRGKKLKVCGCWLNTVGDMGPWSEIHTVIIP